MLIKALCDYSALQENKTPAGYCKQAIHFEILLTPEGKIAAINDLRVPRIIPLKNKKTKTVYDPVMEQLPVRTHYHIPSGQEPLSRSFLLNTSS